jgi:hypothetical protein
VNKRLWVLVAVAVAVLAGGGYYYSQMSRGAGVAQQAPRTRDVGLGVLLAIRTLEREPETQLSREQVGKVLPFVKALKDVPASDADAAGAIARSIRDVFTPKQQAALEAARRGSQQGGSSAGRGDTGPGEGAGDGAGDGAGPRRGGGGRSANRARGGPGGVSEEQRNEFRTRSFDRMIRYLERRMES